MMWLIPRSDPGALTEYPRPHAGAVSTEHGARLPHGPFPRLDMLWMYADCARDPRKRQDPVSSLCDFLLALGLEWMEIAPLFEQANRLVACRFRARDRAMPVIEASVLRRARAAVRVPDVPSLRGMELAYSATFRQEMTERDFQPCLHTLRALRHRPLALDVYLWDACYAARPPRRRARAWRRTTRSPTTPRDARASATSSRSSASSPRSASSAGASRSKRARRARRGLPLEPAASRIARSPRAARQPPTRAPEASETDRVCEACGARGLGADEAEPSVPQTTPDTQRRPPARCRSREF